MGRPISEGGRRSWFEAGPCAQGNEEAWSPLCLPSPLPCLLGNFRKVICFHFHTCKTGVKCAFSGIS